MMSCRKHNLEALLPFIVVKYLPVACVPWGVQKRCSSSLNACHVIASIPPSKIDREPAACSSLEIRPSHYRERRRGLFLSISSSSLFFSSISSQTWRVPSCHASYSWKERSCSSKVDNDPTTYVSAKPSAALSASAPATTSIEQVNIASRARFEQDHLLQQRPFIRLLSHLHLYSS